MTDDMDRMMARTEADRVRPMNDTSLIRDFPKYNRPLVQVGSIFGKTVGWSGSYGLIEWLRLPRNICWPGHSQTASSAWRTN